MIFYFSGELIVENLMRPRAEDFQNVGVLLTYYSLRQSNARASRRLEAMLKGVKYHAPKRKKKAKP